MTSLFEAYGVTSLTPPKEKLSYSKKSKYFDQNDKCVKCGSNSVKVSQRIQCCIKCKKAVDYAIQDIIEDDEFIWHPEIEECPHCGESLCETTDDGNCTQKFSCGFKIKFY